LYSSILFLGQFAVPLYGMYLYVYLFIIICVVVNKK